MEKIVPTVLHTRKRGSLESTQFTCLDNDHWQDGRKRNIASHQTIRDSYAIWFWKHLNLKSKIWQKRFFKTVFLHAENCLQQGLFYIFMGFLWHNRLFFRVFMVIFTYGWIPKMKCINKRGDRSNAGKTDRKAEKMDRYHVPFPDWRRKNRATPWNMIFRDFFKKKSQSMRQNWFDAEKNIFLTRRAKTFWNWL